MKGPLLLLSISVGRIAQKQAYSLSEKSSVALLKLFYLGILGLDDFKDLSQ